jgi:tetratricopeptide (TPR) repeat protein
MAQKQLVLRFVCLAGFILGIVFLGGIMLFHWQSNQSFFKNTQAGASESFYQTLLECDRLLNDPLERDDAYKLLKSLEKDALGLEARLSLLKRLRLLAYRETRFVPDYQKTAEKAAAAFPTSGPLAALASEALLLEEPVLSSERAAGIRTLAPRLHKTDLEPVMLFLYILTEDMKSPERALTLPYKESLWAKSDSLDPIVATDLLLLRIISGDKSVTQTVLNTLTLTSLLKARFFYDYGDPAQAAQLLRQATDETSTVLHADALYRAGALESARILWKTLIADSRVSTTTKTRSFYNLAATAATKDESSRLLERLFAEVPGVTQEADALFATLRYTRLLEPEQAIAILDRIDEEPLIELEIHRRRSQTRSLEKSIAETWVLLDRYPNDERIYQWAAYFFDYQKWYTETAILEKRAERHGITGKWLAIHQALTLMRNKNFDEAEAALQTLLSSYPVWQVPANIALIQEARRLTTAALSSYQKAAEMVNDPEQEAILQLRISQCLSALNRDSESRAALERSLELNPNYLSARVAMRRFNNL